MYLQNKFSLKYKQTFTEYTESNILFHTVILLQLYINLNITFTIYIVTKLPQLWLSSLCLITQVTSYSQLWLRSSFSSNGLGVLILNR